MPIITANASKPKRTLRTPIPAPVDLTITPPYSGASAGQIQSGEMLYKTANGKLASLATLGALATLTTSASIPATGYQHVNTTQNPITQGVVVGMYVTIAATNEVVLVQQVDATGFSANFTATHASGVAVTCTVANSALFAGIANDVYPNTYTAGVTGSPIPPGDSNVPFVHVYEDGDHLMNTTNGDSYNPYDLLYVGADGRTITKVANGVSVGYVSPDQRQSSQLAQPVLTPISGGSGVQIYIRITPALAK